MTADYWLSSWSANSTEIPKNITNITNLVIFFSFPVEFLKKYGNLKYCNNFLKYFKEIPFAASVIPIPGLTPATPIGHFLLTDFGFPSCCYPDWGIGVSMFYLVVYSIIGVLSLGLIFCASLTLAIAGVNASQSVWRREEGGGRGREEGGGEEEKGV
jgi:hypothetical protein